MKLAWLVVNHHNTFSCLTEMHICDKVVIYEDGLVSRRVYRFVRQVQLFTDVHAADPVQKGGEAKRHQLLFERWVQ